MAPPITGQEERAQDTAKIMTGGPVDPILDEVYTFESRKPKLDLEIYEVT